MTAEFAGIPTGVMFIPFPGNRIQIERHRNRLDFGVSFFICVRKGDLKNRCKKYKRDNSKEADECIFVNLRNNIFRQLQS